MRKIRKGDQVIVITGKDKGVRGEVLRVLDEQLLVAGINVVKKHQKPNPSRGVEGGIISFEKAISSSNVALFNAKTQKADRVAIQILEDGNKVRVFKSNGERVDA